MSAEFFKILFSAKKWYIFVCFKRKDSGGDTLLQMAERVSHNNDKCESEQKEQEADSQKEEILQLKQEADNAPLIDVFDLQDVLLSPRPGDEVVDLTDSPKEESVGGVVESEQKQETPKPTDPTLSCSCRSCGVAQDYDLLNYQKVWYASQFHFLPIIHLNCNHS